MEPYGYEFLIGAMFVVFHTMGRFNTPKTSRSGTTAGQYYVAEICYVVFFVIVYWILARSPDVLSQLGVPITEKAGGFASPFLAALCLTLLLPNIPVLSEMDRRARHWLHQIAAIPTEARRLSRKLQSCPWTVREDKHPSKRLKLVAMGVQPNHICFDSPATDAPSYPRHLWTKVSTLMRELNTWRNDTNFGSFLTEFKDEHERLQRRYQGLQQHVQEALADVPAPAKDDASRALTEKARQLTQVFCGQCQELLEEICDLISRGVLRCRVRQCARREELTRMGFTLSEVTYPDLSCNHVAALFLILAVVFLFCFVLVGAQMDQLREKLLKVIMIPLIYSGAVFIAVYPKDRWKMTGRGPDGSRPVLFYLVASVLAAAFALAASAFFNFLIQRGNAKDALEQVITRSPFLLLAFVTAFGTAWLTDNTLHARLGRAQRWLEGAGLAVVTLLTAIVVHNMLGQTMTGQHKECIPEFGLVIPVCGLIGFIIGVLVPTWYRESQGPARLASIGTTLEEPGLDPRMAPEGQLA